MGSGKRRWFWVAAAALVAAVLWQSQAKDVGPVAEPEAPVPVAGEREPEPPSKPEAVQVRPEPTSDEGEPLATPLPRAEVELPAKAVPDGGVMDDDPASVEEKRDRMLRVVIEQLDEDLRAAEEAGDEERAARIRVRRDRLKEQRSESTAP